MFYIFRWHILFSIAYVLFKLLHIHDIFAQCGGFDESEKYSQFVHRRNGRCVTHFDMTSVYITCAPTTIELNFLASTDIQ